MHVQFIGKAHSLVIVGTCLLVASCAQQPTKPVSTPSPLEKTTAPVQPTPTQPTAKPKPKPKPPTPATATKPETPDTEPASSSVEGLEQSKVGYYFDTLQGRLRQLANQNFVVSRHDNTITIDATHSVQFDRENTVTSCTPIAPLAKALVEYRMTHVVIDVAADAGDAPSLGRAKSKSEAVAKCLVDAGVGSRRIAPKGIPGAVQTITLRIEPTVRHP